MVNYFYNIILKTDLCDLYSDVLTSIRKDYYLSREKQKGKITQNSSGDTLFYEFSMEKDKALKWNVSDSKCIISDSKHLDEGKSCVNFYGENGLYKSLTFSKYHTLLKVEYFNVTKTTEPYCTIEPRKAGNGLCLLLTSRENLNPVVLHPMPNIDDDYILDKITMEFDDYTVVASTNEGVIRFLSEGQLESFEAFVDRALAMKLTDTAPISFIDDGDAVLADKLNPKDFNIKRNLSEIVDISQAQEFSYDNIEEELVSDLVVEDINQTEHEGFVEGETAVTTDYDNIVAPQPDLYEVNDDVSDIDVESTEPVLEENKIEDTHQNEQESIIDESSKETFNDEGTIFEEIKFEKNTVAEVLDSEKIEDEIIFEDDNQDDYVIASDLIPDRIIESSSAKYNYFGELDSNNGRSGFGRTSTEDGRTAYEGQYIDNKRNGVGAYYYKDSTLCYYGDWKDNKRNGFGIGISSVDNNIHIGQFSDNKPVGNGVRVDNMGNVKFIKKRLSDGSFVEIRFDNDIMTVRKYDENSNLISQNDSNLMNF